jgi:hypothetical protein
MNESVNIQRRDDLTGSELDAYTTSLLSKVCRLPFSRFLLALLADPDFLRSESRSDHEYDLFQNVLRQWQVAGRPDPEEWTDEEYLQVGAYLRKWMLFHHKNGFIS